MCAPVLIQSGFHQDSSLLLSNSAICSHGVILQRRVGRLIPQFGFM